MERDERKDVVATIAGPNDRADLEQPLLGSTTTALEEANLTECGTPRSCLGDGDRPESFRLGGQCANGGAIANVAVTAVGAGMLALPKAFALVGLGLGVVLFLAVAGLTYFSSSIIIRLAWEGRQRTYGALVKAHLGDSGARVLQSAIILHVLGVMIVYEIVISDMLVGSAPNYHGLLPFILDRQGVWWLSRGFVSGILTVLTVAPMLVSRDLAIVARFSRLSVGMMLFLAATIAGLAAYAVFQGKAAAIHILPVPSEMGGLLGLASCVLTVLAVAALAFTCQFNLLPVQFSLQDTRCSNMLGITRSALALCVLLYGTVAAGGYVLFGDETDGDILKNLTVKWTSTLVPPALAHTLIYAIVICNTCNLLVNFVLKVWALRDSLSELALGRPALSLPPHTFYSLTYGLSAMAWGLSVLIPSVWFLVGLIGSTACVTFSYVIPGIMMAKLGAAPASRAAGQAIVALAAVMAATAVANTLSGNAMG